MGVDGPGMMVAFGTATNSVVGFGLGGVNWGVVVVDFFFFIVGTALASVVLCVRVIVPNTGDQW